PDQQEIGSTNGMKSTGTAEGAADLVPANGLSDVMHDDQSRIRGVAQTQQGLAERGHGTGIVFILIVRGIKRIENDDVGFGVADRSNKVIQPAWGAEQMTSSGGIDEEIGIGGRADGFAHRSEPGGELRGG